jgi:competence protein ComEC
VHLLSISGFHVGVIAALLVGTLRVLGLKPRSARGWAVVACWIYVLGIGAPHAAVRASLLFTLLVAARFRGRPIASSGTLATCALLLLILEPGWLFSVGFQLSFAGTAGLIFLRARVSAGIDAAYRRIRGRSIRSGRRASTGDVLLKEGAAGISAGIAATLPTLPLLVWHFDRISLLGIPLTIVLAPLLAMVIPGIGAALLLSLVNLSLGSFLAGGTLLLLEIANRIVLVGAVLPGASFWVSRSALIWMSGAGCTATIFLRWRSSGRVRPAIRHLVSVGWGCVALLLLPLLPRERVMELHMIDVGQGDAVALRTPSGRWLLVDAGPRSATFDSGARRIVPYLKREGVRRIEALLLTHPHLDHIGGAPAVLAAFDVGGILDPSRPHGSRPYLQVLEAAESDGGSWWRARRGMTFSIDGVTIEVLHPDAAVVEAPDLADPNDLSIVLLVHWGRGTILLTGDAPASVEEMIVDRLPLLTVLKVGHHGSRTASASELLAAGRPGVALIGVGDGNSFGHPHAEVVERISTGGAEILRTDRDGDIRIRIHFDGTTEIGTAR